MPLFRVQFVSEVIYVVDTAAGVFWPEGYPRLRSRMWRAMDPTQLSTFRGKILGGPYATVEEVIRCRSDAAGEIPPPRPCR